MSGLYVMNVQEDVRWYFGGALDYHFKMRESEYYNTQITFPSKMIITTWDTGK